MFGIVTELRSIAKSLSEISYTLRMMHSESVKAQQQTAKPVDELLADVMSGIRKSNPIFDMAFQAVEKQQHLVKAKVGE